MANMHVLAMDGSTARVLLHVAAPVGNNAAGIPWATAIVRSGMGGTTALPDGDGTGGTISAAEKAQILIGAVVEVEGAIIPDSASTNSERQQYIDRVIAQATTEVQERVRLRFRYYGMTR
jgi:hypothetical protein